MWDIFISIIYLYKKVTVEHESTIALSDATNQQKTSLTHVDK